MTAGQSGSRRPTLRSPLVVPVKRQKHMFTGRRTCVNGFQWDFGHFGGDCGALWTRQITETMWQSCWFADVILEVEFLPFWAFSLFLWSSQFQFQTEFQVGCCLINRPLLLFSTSSLQFAQTPVALPEGVSCGPLPATTFCSSQATVSPETNPWCMNL